MEQVTDTQFTCFTSTNGHSIYLLYKYKSTYTDTEAMEKVFSRDVVRDLFALLVCSPAGLTQVDLLELLGYGFAASRYSVYLLYWYKSTITNFSRSPAMGLPVFRQQQRRGRGHLRQP